VSPQKIVARIFQRYWRYSRGLTLGVQGMVLDKDNRILLVKRDDSPGWQLPGGAVEEGEAAEDALRRLLLADVGIEISGPPELAGLHANHGLYPGDHVAVLVVRVWQQVRARGHEIPTHAFLPRDDLPDHVAETARRRIRELLAGEPRSPHS
jgi:ADP-ribose pyrophosphatase YjhB (NUDIX family)